MLLSKSMFDLDSSNNSIIKIEVKSSPDVRDKIAKRFIESLANTSQWCEILPSGENEYLIFPLKPQELRRTAEYMLARADEWDAQNKKFTVLVENA